MENIEINCKTETSGSKPIICKGALCRKGGEALVIEDIEVAPPKAWEVRIKILCTSLCHTDLSFWKIDSGPFAAFPRIFGHEAVGIVESVGEQVEEVKEGDTVVPVFFADCGECKDCKSPKSNVCNKFVNNNNNTAMPRDEVGRFKDMNGEPVHHFLSVSSFAEYTVVDITHVVKIPPQLPLHIACLLSCGVATGALCRKGGEALVIEDIEVAPPKAWEVRIKILCTSLCHTDLSFWKIDSGPFAAFPRIFGHEAVGIVESVGEQVEEVKEGDTVVPVFFADCGECKDCKSPKSNVCNKFVNNNNNTAMPRDEVGRFKDMNGEPVHHFLSVSSFAEYTVVDITHVVKIPPQLPLHIACLLSCGVATGIGAVWKVAQVEEGATVAIFGLGAVGLAVAQAAKLQGASKIIGVDLNPRKEDIGKRFGVTDFINPKSCGENKKISHAIEELTEGGADYCFECVGSTTVMQDAFESSRQGWGKTIILGVEMRGIPLNLNSLDILRGRSVMGSMFGGIKPKSDIPLLIQKYLNQELCLDGFVTQQVNFHEINKAFEYLIQGDSLRCIIWIGQQINNL